MSKSRLVQAKEVIADFRNIVEKTHPGSFRNAVQDDLDHYRRIAERIEQRIGIAGLEWNDRTDNEGLIVINNEMRKNERKQNEARRKKRVAKGDALLERFAGPVRMHYPDLQLPHNKRFDKRHGGCLGRCWAFLAGCLGRHQGRRKSRIN